MKHSNIMWNCEYNIKFGLILLKFLSSVIYRKLVLFDLKIYLNYKKTIDIKKMILQWLLHIWSILDWSCMKLMSAEPQFLRTRDM